MKLTKQKLYRLIQETMNEAKAISVKSLPVVQGEIGVVLTKADYDKNKSKMFGIQVARFDHSGPVPLYRIIDEEEYNVHIPAAGGKITGGDFQPMEEKDFGASFGFDPKLLLGDFAGGQRKHLKKQNYLVYIPDANGMMFANMELTHDKYSMRGDAGLKGGSKTSPYKGSMSNKLKKKKLPHKFTIPDDLCHPIFGCQMVVDTKAAGAIFYKIGSGGSLTQVPAP